MQPHSTSYTKYSLLIALIFHFLAHCAVELTHIERLALIVLQINHGAVPTYEVWSRWTFWNYYWRRQQKRCSRCLKKLITLQERWIWRPPTFICTSIFHIIITPVSTYFFLNYHMPAHWVLAKSLVRVILIIIIIFQITGLYYSIPFKN